MRRLHEGIEVHDTLNPKLWDRNNNLRPDVRDKMLEIVEYFKEYLENVPLDVVDIQFVGSNASYNYTSHSDIDLHIIVNYEMIDASKELLDMLYNVVKASFNSTYDILIKGLECEIYVEDVKAGVTSNGIYSVLNDEWIKFPQKLTDIPQVELSRELRAWTHRIDRTLNSDDMELVKKDINDLYMIRKNSISIDGEYGKGNQLFKEVRNAGLLDALKDKVTELQSQELSLESFRIEYDNELDEDFSMAHCPRFTTTVRAKNSQDAIKIFKSNYPNFSIYEIFRM